MPRVPPLSRALATALIAVTVPLAYARPDLERVHDAVIVPVAQLPGVERHPSGGFSLHRWTPAGLVPIPTQFDARAPSGDLDVAADASFVLDANDELVFMAKDAGPRAPRAALPAEALLEIRLEDPRNGARAWAYLVAAPAPPPAEPYAVLELERRRAHSAYYDVEYADGRNFFTAMRILPAGGGNGADLLRQTRMLGEPRFSLFFTDLRLSFTEKNSIVRVEGIRNGPVRAIRRVHLSVDLGPFFPDLPNGTVYTLHYLSSFSTPTRISIPWLILQALEDFRFENVLEFDDRVRPLRYFDGAHPDGVPFEPGIETSVELDRDHEWFAVGGDSGTFLQVFLVPDEWREWGIARGTIVRAGNGSAASAAGFTLLNMTRLQRPGEHRMQQATVVLPRPYQPGDEAAALATFHAPLGVHITALPPH